MPIDPRLKQSKVESEGGAALWVTQCRCVVPRCGEGKGKGTKVEAPTFWTSVRKESGSSQQRKKERKKEKYRPQ